MLLEIRREEEFLDVLCERFLLRVFVVHSPFVLLHLEYLHEPVSGDDPASVAQ